MAFEHHMAACASEQDRIETESADLAREEARLEALARAEAAAGNFEKLWTAVDYGDNDREVLAALCACARGEPGAQQAAQMVVTLLAKTYAANYAEVSA